MNTQSIQMTDEALKEANDAFGRQISSQVARITGELNRLEQLLSAGQVDRRVLAEFREAVNKVRKTSWHVQCWLDGDLRSLASLMIEERILVMSQLAGRLASDLQSSSEPFTGLLGLRKSIKKLDDTLEQKLVVEEPVGTGTQ